MYLMMMTNHSPKMMGKGTIIMNKLEDEQQIVGIRSEFMEK